MEKILKISGSFPGVGDTVSLSFPDSAQEVALRLYENGLEIALWFVVADPLPDANTLTRNFMLISGDDLPANFVKYIGSLLVAAADAHVIEVS